MNDTPPRPLVTEAAAAQPNVAPAPKSDSDNEALAVQRRFRLAGSGMASRTLQTAILALPAAKGKN